jgi:hypothetical protein
MMQACNAHVGVNVSWHTGDLGCPLCDALKSVAELRSWMADMVTRVELVARLDWLTKERDAWKERALVSEAQPGQPYHLEEQ